MNPLRNIYTLECFSFVSFFYLLGEIAGCKEKSDLTGCYKVVNSSALFKVDMCTSVSGYPPRLLLPGTAKEVWDFFKYLSIPFTGLWVGLTTDEE